MLGLGVFQSPPAETTAAVKTAIADGYRLIDTAAAYDNSSRTAWRCPMVRPGLLVPTKRAFKLAGYLG